jgi:hypothetical protein
VNEVNRAPPDRIHDLTRRPHEALVPQPGDPRLIEAMLYFGNECNRECGFCCVEGSPAGGFVPLDAARIAQVLALIRPDARIKLYGGEPTLRHRHMIGVVRALRAEGYVGRLTIFSNGVQAGRLIAMLEADPPTSSHRGTDAYLNQAIWYGRGAPGLPPGRRARLLDWAADNPGRLFLSHADVLPVGAASRDPDAAVPEQPVRRTTKLDDGASTQAEWTEPGFGGRCARCHPTLRSDGRIHACAFAANVDSPLYDLGELGDAAQDVAVRHRRFLEWIDSELEPAAADAGASPCTLCLQHARGDRLVQLTGSA